ncbi:hypothetical protein IV203_032420 [Nitzschia inconspicua]|uniref:Uncharacterized protein n=1 Tax=Nitzschia inconspicua TaxID=303405 RepID=A0A9K3KKP7_9STRA|nr:hypothetical protein IV203_032420 [Nitzschia inconspicua]
MPFVPDKTHWTSDIYHALGSWFLVEDGLHRNMEEIEGGMQNVVFPSWRKTVESSTAKLLTQAIQKCLPDDIKMPKDTVTENWALTNCLELLQIAVTQSTEAKEAKEELKQLKHGMVRGADPTTEWRKKGKKPTGKFRILGGQVHASKKELIKKLVLDKHYSKIAPIFWNDAMAHTSGTPPGHQPAGRTDMSSSITPTSTTNTTTHQERSNDEQDLQDDASTTEDVLLHGTSGRGSIQKQQKQQQQQQQEEAEIAAKQCTTRNVMVAATIQYYGQDNITMNNNNNNNNNNDDSPSQEEEEDGGGSNTSHSIFKQSSSHNVTLDNIWKDFTETTNQCEDFNTTITRTANAANNDNNNNTAALQQAIQQTTALLLQEYERFVRPSQKAILEKYKFGPYKKRTNPRSEKLPS